MGVSNLIHGKYKVPFSESFQFSTLSRRNSRDLQRSDIFRKPTQMTTYYDKTTLNYFVNCLCGKCKFIEHSEAVEKKSIFVCALRFFFFKKIQNYLNTKNYLIKFLWQKNTMIKAQICSSKPQFNNIQQSNKY